MVIQDVSCVYFSPTGTTEKIAESIAQGFQAERINKVDCTKRSKRQEFSQTFQNEIVVLAAPVYYGRVPEEVVPFFSKLHARQTPAVLVVVYGNRAYEDALKELYDITVKQGFVPVAAGAFVAEHSYSSPTYPIAHDRPDGNDLKKAEAFGDKIRRKLNHLGSLESIEQIIVPGNIPYIEPHNLLMLKQYRESVALTPETDTAICTQCNLCAEVCPTGAINPDDVSKIDRWQCLICYACIKNCPLGAKQMPNEFNQAIIELQKACLERKEPEVFL